MVLKCVYGMKYWRESSMRGPNNRRMDDYA